MAYEPTVWNCDDGISAEKLNKLEEGVAQIMSDYVPTQWSCGDTITAEKLNKLEQAVAEASEGGSSDFSTAQVTFVNDSEDYFECPMAVIRDGEMYFATISEAATYTTPLYNGSVILPNINPANVSGNAEKKGSGLSRYVEITGDCTITIS